MNTFGEYLLEEPLLFPDDLYEDLCEFTVVTGTFGKFLLILSFFIFAKTRLYP